MTDGTSLQHIARATGEDFYLKPGEVFTITPEAEGVDVWFSTLVWEGGITVWLYEDGDPTRIVLEYVVTDADGIQLECGHQRLSKSAGSDVAERGEPPGHGAGARFCRWVRVCRTNG
ncbi:hypothetical protein ACGFR6_33265 [Streptomyces sp. NPDC048567]|uniref:hypothetical protein n=1 Tax=Streptomyces sp. NPDC048567 TaxID=3365570 RepID=UPI003716C9F3